MESKHYKMIENKSRNQNLSNIKTFALLPTWFKPLGCLLVLISFLAFIGIVWLNIEPEPARTFVRTSMLLGFFLIAISKDKLEDERTVNLRTQSFAWAFLFGIAYTLIFPYLEFGIDSIRGAGESIRRITSFESLSMLLAMQIGFYHYLKLKY